MWGIIGTWKMVSAGVNRGAEILAAPGDVFDALEACIRLVEDCADYTSVGYGGLPNALGTVEADAAFMDGETLSFGAVAALKDFANPCAIARKLMAERFNNLLVADGAETYAAKHGFVQKKMLTERSRRRWQEHRELMERGELNPYTGHDTVCAVGLDQTGHMATCTSTSGLFYKAPGRVGDSPVPGAGFYVDNAVGGACATGLGEDILKGALSFQIVRLMGKGLAPQEACEKAVNSLDQLLSSRRGRAGDLSAIAMNRQGDFGAATNIETFPFVVSTAKQPLTIYAATCTDGAVAVKEL